MTDLHQLIEQTIVRHVAPAARVGEVRERSGGTQGYSGATLRSYDVTYALPDGTTADVALVTKDAPLRERRVFAWLAEQHQPGVPWSYTADLETDVSTLVCMQDMGGEAQPSAEISKKAAEVLASIHAANFGKTDQLPWLPHADHAYFEGSFVLVDWREQWNETMRIEEFARVWGPECPRLEEAAARFLADMNQLWAEGDSLTLIHADLHNDHVLVHGNEPYIIDWGQARYGSFYLDLPNYFAPDAAQHYRETLADLGYAKPEAAFMERYRMAGRYVAFKYMGVTLWSYRQGYSRLDRGQWGLFNLALNGQ